MSRNFVKIWCEWEVGQDEVIFKTAAMGIRWLDLRLKECGINETVNDLMDQGLCGFEPIQLVEKINENDY